MPKISAKRQVTLPVASLERSGLKPGNEVTVEAEGPDRIVVVRAEPDRSRAFGVFDGLYETNYFDPRRAGRRRLESFIRFI